MFKRILAVILLCIFIPVSAFSEAFHFQLSFSSVDATKDSILSGILDFMEMLQVSGTFQRNSDHGIGFDLTSSMTLDGDESTRMDFHLWGLEGLFHIESPVWNNENILINVPAMLEYGNKIYNHLDIPLQRFCILYPYVTYNAFEPVLWAILETMQNTDATQTEWIVSSESLEALGSTLADMQYNERGLRIWLDTMSTMNVAGEELSEIWANIPDWLSENVGEITVVKTASSESWKTSSHTLFSTATQSDGSYEVHIMLPGFIFGEDASYDYVRTVHDDSYDVDLRLAFGTDEHVLLNGSCHSRSLPDNWPAEGPFDAVLDLQGPLLYGLGFLQQSPEGLLESSTLQDALHVEFQGDPDHISLMNGDTALITMHMNATPFTPETEVYHRLTEWGGLNFFSLYDSTLSEFMDSAKDSLIEALFPLVIHAPVSTVVALMDVLQDAGILDILAYGLDISFEDEEAWDEEEWDEETSSEESDW